MNRLFLSLSLLFSVSLFTGDWLTTATHATLKSGLALDVTILAADAVVCDDLLDELAPSGGNDYPLTAYIVPTVGDFPSAAILKRSRSASFIRAPPHSQA
ncbi:MAG: hypothetical protein WCY88_13120 [Spongiibacteraceae bacterium]